MIVGVGCVVWKEVDNSVEINVDDSGLKVVGNVELIVEVGMSVGLSDVVEFDIVEDHR